VALRVWHGSLARRRKTVILITDVGGHVNSPLGDAPRDVASGGAQAARQSATPAGASGDVGAHGPLLGIVESSLRRSENTEHDKARHSLRSR